MCVGYRLAPQHPFPAGLDDAVAVYRALLSSHGYRASSIGIMGDSAGESEDVQERCWLYMVGFCVHKAWACVCVSEYMCATISQSPILRAAAEPLMHSSSD